jgi:uncharacterized membrane protein
MGLLVAALVVMIVLASVAFVARNPWLLIGFGGIFLALAYLALVFSWDVWHVSSKGFEGIGPGPQVLALRGPLRKSV